MHLTRVNYSTMKDEIGRKCGNMYQDELVLFIVEGKSDKQKLEQILNNNVPIICTNGTIDEEDLLDLLERYEQYDFVTFFDADKNGEKLRKIMKRIYPEAIQLQIPKQFKEVAETPIAVLLDLLKREKFNATIYKNI